MLVVCGTVLCCPRQAMQAERGGAGRWASLFPWGFLVLENELKHETAGFSGRVRAAQGCAPRWSPGDNPLTAIAVAR